MKKLLKISAITLSLCLSVISCAHDSGEVKKENKTENKKAETIDTAKTAQSVKEEPEKIEPAKVTCSLFFESMEFTDDETGETIPSSVEERTDFRLKKAYTYCYDSEDFHHLTIKGTGKKLTFLVKDGNKKIFAKENFDLTDKITFTPKDFDLGPSCNIIISQGETVVFSGKIDYQGCM